MTTTILTRRQFDSDTDSARRAATRGPVIITDRGEKSHVLLTIEDYERLYESHTSIVDRLAMPEAEEVELEPPRLADRLSRSADLS